MTPGLWALVLILAFLVLVTIPRAIVVIRPYQRGVVEVLGKYRTTFQPGWHLVVPFITAVRIVDMRERVIDVPPQEVITKDNVVLTIDAVVYYEVTDPFRVVYNVRNFELAVIKLAQTSLRNIVGDMELDETLTSRERINAELRRILDDATDKWGARVTRVELQRIDPPADITEAMSKQMKAERERRAMILEAEGVKQSAILKAEGTKQAQILEAEGKAQAIKQVADAEKYREIAIAEGQAQAIRTIFQAIHEGKPTTDLITIRYLDALAKIADGKATKIFLPIEATGVLGGLAAIGEMFREGRTPPSDEDG